MLNNVCYNSRSSIQFSSVMYLACRHFTIEKTLMLSISARPRSHCKSLSLLSRQTSEQCTSHHDPFQLYLIDELLCTLCGLARET
jgi:hypothetical protein